MATIDPWFHIDVRPLRKIELRGIVRNLSENVHVDGVMEDVVNMRYEHGGWRATNDKVACKRTEDGNPLPIDYTQIYVHTNGIYHHVLGVKDANLWWWAEVCTAEFIKTLNAERRKNGQPIELLREGNWYVRTVPKLLCALNSEVHYTQTGNLLTLTGSGLERNIHLYFNESTGEYSLYDNDYNGTATDSKLTPDGKVDFRVVPDVDGSGRVKVCAAVRRRTQPHSSASIPNVWGEYDKNYIRSYFLRLDAIHKKSKSFNKPFLVCAAFLTYSGEYILASRPKLMWPQSLMEDGDEVTLNMRHTLASSTGMSYQYSDHTLRKRVGAPYVLAPAKTCFDSYHLVEDVSLGGELLWESRDKEWTGIYQEGPGDWCGIADMTTLMKANDDNNSWSMYPANYFYADEFGNYLSCFGVKTKLQINIDSDILNRYKDIILNVGVFITPMAELYSDNYHCDKVEGASPDSTVGVRDKIFWYDMRDKRDIKKDLMRSNFYLLSEIDIDMLNSGWFDVEIEDGVLENLVHQERLKSDTTARNSFSAEIGYNYNGRLHLANLTEQRFLGYPLNYFYENKVESCFPVEEYWSHRLPPLFVTPWWDYWQNEHTAEAAAGTHYNDLWSYYTEVEIEETDGTYKVLRYGLLPSEPATVAGQSGKLGSYVCSLNACISYPDRRARKMRIVAKRYEVGYDVHGSLDKGHAITVKEYALEPHHRLNMACYISDDLRPIALDNAYLRPQYVYELPSGCNIVRHRPNGLRVSAVDNPLYFPSSASYNIGNMGIVAMASNEKAVSNTETGDAPMYVFCKDGIYALFVDVTGEIAYKYARGIARDVCNNPKGVKRVDGGIVFTTDRGIMVLNQGVVRDISDDVEGRVMAWWDKNNAVDYTSGITGLFEHANFGDMRDKFYNSYWGTLYDKPYCDDLLSYIENAEIAYNHNRKELIVYDHNKPYYYLCSSNGMWSRVTGIIHQLVEDYPRVYALMGDDVNYNIYDFEEEQNGLVSLPDSASNRIFMLTRAISPQKAPMWSKDSRVMFTCNIDTFGAKVGMYVFGSNDGLKWAWLGGTEREGKIREISCDTFRHNCRYIRVCIAGEIGSGTINSILIDER